MGPCLKIRHCSCTKLVDKCTLIYLSMNIYNKYQHIYVYHFMSSSFNQFLLRLTDSQCNRLGLELFFGSDSMLCKIYMSTEHDKTLILHKLQQSWAGLRSAQTRVSLIWLIKDTCRVWDAGQSQVHQLSWVHMSFLSHPFSPALPLPFSPTSLFPSTSSPSFSLPMQCCLVQRTLK